MLFHRRCLALALLWALAGCGSAATGPSDYYDALEWTGPQWHWHRSPITVGVDTERVPDGYRPEFRDAVAQAAARWSAVGVVGLEMAPEGTPQVAADIRIRFAGQGEMAASERYGESFPDSDGQQLVHVDTVLSVGVPGPMYPLALHELGHGLGILGHSPNDADVMNATYSPSRTDPTARDINTLRRIYAP